MSRKGFALNSPSFCRQTAPAWVEMVFAYRCHAAFVGDNESASGCPREAVQLFLHGDAGQTNRHGRDDETSVKARGEMGVRCGHATSIYPTPSACLNHGPYSWRRAT